MSTQRPRPLPSLLLTAALAAGCGGSSGSGRPGHATIVQVTFRTSTAVIGGPPIVYDVTLQNPDGRLVYPFLLQNWVVQGAARRAAGGSYAVCGANPVEVLPEGSCTFAVGLDAGDDSAHAGTGTLAPGQASVVVELRLDGVPEDEVIDTVTVPISLTR